MSNGIEYLTNNIFHIKDFLFKDIKVDYPLNDYINKNIFDKFKNWKHDDGNKYSETLTLFGNALTIEVEASVEAVFGINEESFLGGCVDVMVGWDIDLLFGLKIYLEKVEGDSDADEQSIITPDSKKITNEMVKNIDTVLKEVMAKKNSFIEQESVKNKIKETLKKKFQSTLNTKIESIKDRISISKERSQKIISQVLENDKDLLLIDEYLANVDELKIDNKKSLKEIKEKKITVYKKYLLDTHSQIEVIQTEIRKRMEEMEGRIEQEEQATNEEKENTLEEKREVQAEKKATEIEKSKALLYKTLTQLEIERLKEEMEVVKSDIENTQITIKQKIEKLENKKKELEKLKENIQKVFSIFIENEKLPEIKKIIINIKDDLNLLIKIKSLRTQLKGLKRSKKTKNEREHKLSAIQKYNNEFIEAKKKYYESFDNEDLIITYKKVYSVRRGKQNTTTASLRDTNLESVKKVLNKTEINLIYGMTMIAVGLHELQEEFIKLNKKAIEENVIKEEKLDAIMAEVLQDDIEYLESNSVEEIETEMEIESKTLYDKKINLLKVGFENNLKKKRKIWEKPEEIKSKKFRKVYKQIEKNGIEDIVKYTQEVITLLDKFIDFWEEYYGLLESDETTTEDKISKLNKKIAQANIRMTNLKIIKQEDEELEKEKENKTLDIAKEAESLEEEIRRYSKKEKELQEKIEKLQKDIEDLRSLKENYSEYFRYVALSIISENFKVNIEEVGEIL